MDQLELILKNHGFRKTSFRKELLGLFYECKASLTAGDIRSMLESSIDKVTIYRALDSFEENGLIHKVPDKNNVTRYALSQTECDSKGQKTSSHAHFICNNCDKTFCIDDIKVPEVKNIDSGFSIKKTTLTLEGYCPDCKN